VPRPFLLFWELFANAASRKSPLVLLANLHTAGPDASRLVPVALPAAGRSPDVRGIWSPNLFSRAPPAYLSFL